jgi:hypothetical protein
LSREKGEGRTREKGEGRREKGEQGKRKKGKGKEILPFPFSLLP